MATILQFPGKRPSQESLERHEEVNGFFGVKLSKLLAAVQYYACVKGDQNSAFDLLFEVAELDTLNEYVGIPVEFRPLIISLEESTIYQVALGNYNDTDKEED